MSPPHGPKIRLVLRRHDPRFVGRAEELAALEQALAATGPSALTQPACMHGLGGVGKTLLAVKYARRHDADYDAILWLAAENPTALAPAFAELARTLRLPEAEERDQNVRITAVLTWLEAHDRWLLVFDNAERREDVEPYIPQHLTGHVLITSRSPDWDPLAWSIRIGPLPRPDSIALLLAATSSGAEAEAEADRLADALGDLPLALAQAAAYLRETACSFADYRAKLDASWAAFDAQQSAEPGYGRTIAATLKLALDRIKGDLPNHSPAEVVLARCAFYAPEAIPRDLLADDPLDEAALNEAIRTLRRYSLLETQPGFVAVHRLVQRAVRDRLDPESRAEFAEHAVQKLRARFPDDPDDVRTWLECRKLLDHTLNATERASEDQVAATTVANLLNQVGIHLSAYHDLPRAKSLLLRSLRIEEAAYGPDHPEVASTLTNLGIVAREQGDLAEARRGLERALRIKEAAYGPDHPHVASTLGNLGNVAQEQGDLGEARRGQERALRIFEAAYGPDHPHVASTLTNLGNVAQEQGDLAEARRCQERALRITEAAYGPDHPHVASTLGNLGLVARAQGDLAEARRGLERALGIFEAAYGPDHPEVARTLTNLGIVMATVREFEQAQVRVERALEICRRSLGDEHPNTIQARGLLQEIEDQRREAQRPSEPGGGMTKVLVLAANPVGTPPLKLDEEVRAIDAKIRGSEHRDLIRLVSHWAVRLDALSGLLMRERPDVVHFSGHGMGTGELVLVGDDGIPKPIPAEAVARMLQVLKDKVRVVVLNACHSEPLARAIVKEIDCAVGMSAAIGDQHAIAFAAEFYQALGFGKSVQAAFDLGVARLIGEGVAAADGLVKLHMREGVKPSAVILVGAGTEPAPGSSPGIATEVQPMAKPEGQKAPAPTVGIITALPTESAAVRAVLGEPPRIDVPGSGAGRAYWMAEVTSPQGGVHRVVIAQADMGTNSAAIRAGQLLTHFPDVGSIIMCGIAGGLPNPDRAESHVRLGDIVVSNWKGVVQYDMTTRTGRKGRKKADALGVVAESPRPPSASLLQAVRLLEADIPFDRFPWEERIREG
ncbi:MAG: FxSxx-COOH system tetratricopeptide repeat protein, partial [Planctomycetaceae bacterium]